MVPALLKMRGAQRTPWGGESSNAEFTTDLLCRFNAGQMVIWAKVDPETGDLDYFMAVIKENKDTALFWLFYIDIKLRAISAELTKNSIDKIKAMGYKKIQLTTRRLTKSYSRWMGKLGFKPLKLLYEKELTNG
jgi:hypothetical protein